MALKPQVAKGLHPDNRTNPLPSQPLKGGRGAEGGCRHWENLWSGNEEACKLGEKKNASDLGQVATSHRA